MQSLVLFAPVITDGKLNTAITESKWLHPTKSFHPLSSNVSSTAEHYSLQRDSVINEVPEISITRLITREKKRINR